MGKKFCILNCDTSETEKILSLFKEFPDFVCSGVSQNYDESLNLVLSTQPELIIIDIDLNYINSINSPFAFVVELFQFLDYSPAFIAISSSTQMAYKVIKLGFCDYLLKPLSELDLRKSLSRLKKAFKEHPEKICIKSNSDHRFIDLDCILFLKADNNTTDFYLQDESKITGYETLKYYESILPAKFLRVHNSYVVNTEFLVRINFSKSNLSLKGTSTAIPFSRSHRRKMESLKQSFYALSTL